MSLDAAGTPPPLDGYSVEHILLSVTVVHENRIMQYDDSCGTILKKALENGYAGVVRVFPQALYKHGQTEVHAKGCECHYCHPPLPREEREAVPGLGQMAAQQRERVLMGDLPPRGEPTPHCGPC